ncbi:MAG: hypothetical protein OHK0017_04780 [Patescibacteria group bacterium]
MAEDKADVKVVKTVKRRLIKIRELPKFWRRILGLCIILIGMASVFLPIIPSWLIILIGFAIISRDAWYWMEVMYSKYLNWRGKKGK